MEKIYEKNGSVLKEINSKTIENEYSLKDLRNRKKFLLSEIDDLKIKRDEIQALIDKAVELKVIE